MNNKGRTSINLAVSAATLLLTLSSPTALATDKAKLNVTSQVQADVDIIDRYAKRKPNEEPQYYLVQLYDEPVTQYSSRLHQQSVQSAAGLQARATTKMRVDLQSTDAQTHQSFLLQEQQAFAASMKQSLPQAQLVEQLTTVLNAVVVQVPHSVQKSQLEALPGVKKVYHDKQYYPLMDRSPQTIQAPEVWATLQGREQAGKGIRIAVIDTGIASDHAMFSDSHMAAPALQVDDDYCALVDTTFCNNKVIVARISAPEGYAPTSDFETPYDTEGHGSHVAGIAAGSVTEVTYQGKALEISGVAPGAYIMSYKALFLQTNGSVTGSTITLGLALEQAVNDGADIINNSWGGDPGEPVSETPYLQAFLNAEAAGVLVVSAAGNDGPHPYTLNCPGCIETGLTVAANDHGRYFKSQVSYKSALWDSQPGQGNFAWAEDIQAKLTLLDQVQPNNATACSAISNDAAYGRIVLAKRGDCTFTEKAHYAEQAGAVGLVVEDNVTEGSLLMTMLMEDATLPSVFVTTDTGEAIRNRYEADLPFTIKQTRMDTDSSRQHRVANFSSRGPNGDATYLKPDITAPGVNVLSAVPSANGLEVGLSNGTSMATPQVAGAAALLQQMRPELSVHQQKSVLMGTANSPASIEGLDYFARGAGIVDVYAATQAGFALKQASTLINPCFKECQFDHVIENITDKELILDIGFDSGPLDIGLTFVAQEQEGSSIRIAVPAQSSIPLTVTIDSRLAAEHWNFLQFKVQEGDKKQTFPIVLSAIRADDNRFFYSHVLTGEPSWGETATVSTLLRGTEQDGQAELTVSLPQQLTVVDVKVEEEYASGSFKVTDKEARWVGSFQQASDISSLKPLTSQQALSLKTLESQGKLLSDLGALGCADAGCDEIAIAITDLMEFGGVAYNGDLYDTLTLWDNGIVAPGYHVETPSTYYNLGMPNQERPNNIIAPLWADFNIGDAFSGEIYYALTQHEDTMYLAVEWNDVSTFVDYGIVSEDKYTFAVWLPLGSNLKKPVLFHYLDVPAMPNYATIGMEDIYGTHGVQYYFDGQGTAVHSNTVLAVNLQPKKGKVNVVIELALDEGKDLSVTSFKDEVLTYNILNEVKEQRINDTSESTVILGNEEYHAFTPIRIRPHGTRSVELVTQSVSNGTIQNTKSGFTYTPSKGFVGTEKIRYRLVDDADNATQEYSVTIQVIEQSQDKKSSSGQLGYLVLLFFLVYRLRNFRKNNLS